MATIRDEILEAGVFERYSDELASGDPANNHLSFDEIDTESVLFRRIVSGMVDLILINNEDVGEIDFLAPIPSGGDRLADAISEIIRKPVVYFDKVESTPGQKDFKPHNWLDLGFLKRNKNGIIIDDVSTSFTSLEGMLRVSELAGKCLQYCGIWRRGNSEIEVPIDENIEKYWLVEEYIARELPANSPLWRYARQETEQAS